jgi:6-phosphofructokinase
LRTRPSSAAGDHRGPPALVVNNIKELGLETLVVIGGDGSLKIGYGCRSSASP